MLLAFKLGQAGVCVEVGVAWNGSGTSPGDGFPGLTNATAGLKIAVKADNEVLPTTYTAAGGLVETIAAVGAYAAPTAGRCRLKLVDDANCPGLIQLQFEDSRFAVAGAKYFTCWITGVTGMAHCRFIIPLWAVDPYSGSFGLAGVDLANLSPNLATLVAGVAVYSNGATTPPSDGMYVCRSLDAASGVYTRSYYNSLRNLWLWGNGAGYTLSAAVGVNGAAYWTTPGLTTGAYAPQGAATGVPGVAVRGMSVLSPTQPTGGSGLDQLPPAQFATAVWDASQVAHAGAGTFGLYLDGILSTRASQATLAAFLATLGTPTPGVNVTSIDADAIGAAAFSNAAADKVAGRVAPLVWNEPKSAHVAAGTFGAFLDASVSSRSTFAGGAVDLSAWSLAAITNAVGASQGDPWAKVLATGNYATGTAGAALQDVKSSADTQQAYGRAMPLGTVVSVTSPRSFSVQFNAPVSASSVNGPPKMSVQFISDDLASCAMRIASATTAGGTNTLSLVFDREFSPAPVPTTSKLILLRG